MALLTTTTIRRKKSRRRFVALGQDAQGSTFNDASADVPPVENLTKYTKMGFDLELLRRQRPL